jgi:hypothetical protein
MIISIAHAKCDGKEYLVASVLAEIKCTTLVVICTAGIDHFKTNYYYNHAHGGPFELSGVNHLTLLE